MKEAYRLFSWAGILQTQIKATEINSRAEARKLGPFFNENRHLVTWVNWHKRADDTIVKAYFRDLPKNTIKNQNKSLSLDFNSLLEEKQTSSIHNKVRDLFVELLTEYIQQNKEIKWYFKDKRVSDFSLSGNLLAEVVEVVPEYEITTTFGNKYRFDVALLGKKIVNKKIILGVIEVENTHRFEIEKCLISKSLGFPLISIDISETLESEINKNWCIQVLEESTKNSENSLRKKNFIDIHNVLYPVYLNIPSKLRENNVKHQYIIFTSDENFEKLFKLLQLLQKALQIKDTEVSVQKVRLNPNVETSLTTFENEGSIAGLDWRKFNENQYIRLSLNIPFEKSGNLYLYHLAMASLINSYIESYTGYKYEKGIKNQDVEQPLWIIKESYLDTKEYRLLPKHLSEPIHFIFRELGLSF